MHEAAIEQRSTGRLPADDGWFILNLAEIGWEAVPGGGTWCAFESPNARSPILGIGVHVLEPGEAPGFYHAESGQEGFLVLSGECIAIVEGEERRMGPWDYLHCPPGTAHITVGAGDAPCAILMVGIRSPDRSVRYLVDPAAARHGRSVPEETGSSAVAYAERPPIVEAPSPWPQILAG
jgi:quercetin dioxygenase-like cupin family protein